METDNYNRIIEEPVGKTKYFTKLAAPLVILGVAASGALMYASD
jgi:hypothetical protein